MLRETSRFTTSVDRNRLDPSFILRRLAEERASIDFSTFPFNNEFMDNAHLTNLEKKKLESHAEEQNILPDMCENDVAINTNDFSKNDANYSFINGPSYYSKNDANCPTNSFSKRFNPNERPKMDEKIVNKVSDDRKLERIETNSEEVEFKNNEPIHRHICFNLKENIMNETPANDRINLGIKENNFNYVDKKSSINMISTKLNINKTDKERSDTIAHDPINSIDFDEIMEENLCKDNISKNTITEDNLAIDYINKDNIIKDKITKDNIIKDKITKHNITKDKITKDNNTKDSITKDKITRENITEDKIIKDKIIKDNDSHNIISEHMGPNKITNNSIIRRNEENNRATFEHCYTDIKLRNNKCEENLYIDRNENKLYEEFKNPYNDASEIIKKNTHANSDITSELKIFQKNDSYSEVNNKQLDELKGILHGNENNYKEVCNNTTSFTKIQTIDNNVSQTRPKCDEILPVNDNKGYNFNDTEFDINLNPENALNLKMRKNPAKIEKIKSTNISDFTPSQGSGKNSEKPVTDDKHISKRNNNNYLTKQSSSEPSLLKQTSILPQKPIFNISPKVKRVNSSPPIKNSNQQNNNGTFGSTCNNLESSLNELKLIEHEMKISNGTFKENGDGEKSNIYNNENDFKENRHEQKSSEADSLQLAYEFKIKNLSNEKQNKTTILAKKIDSYEQHGNKNNQVGSSFNREISFISKEDSGIENPFDSVSSSFTFSILSITPPIETHVTPQFNIRSNSSSPCSKYDLNNNFSLREMNSEKLLLKRTNTNTHAYAAPTHFTQHFIQCENGTETINLPISLSSYEDIDEWIMESFAGAKLTEKELWQMNIAQLQLILNDLLARQKESLFNLENELTIRDEMLTFRETKMNECKVRLKNKETKENDQSFMSKKNFFSGFFNIGRKSK